MNRSIQPCVVSHQDIRLTESTSLPIIRRRGVEQRQLVGLITRRSEVRILSPQPSRLFPEPRARPPGVLPLSPAIANFAALDGHLETVPGAEAWAVVADPNDRLRLGLRELFGWYRANELMLRNVLSDIDPTAPPPTEPDLFDLRMGSLFEALAEGWSVARDGDRPTLLAVLAHATAFETWRSLTRRWADRRAGGGPAFGARRRGRGWIARRSDTPLNLSRRPALVAAPAPAGSRSPGAAAASARA